MSDLSKYNIRNAGPSVSTTALIVIDMQEHFRDTASGIISKVKKLVSVCRKKNIRIIYTRHAHTDLSKDGGMLSEWWAEEDLIMKGSSNSEILKELKPIPSDKIIQKNRYSAFYGTELEEYLHGRSITDIIISGVVTNLCCETTARDAFVRDFRVFFLSDGTSASEKELHSATLKNLAYGFAYIKTCGEIIKALK